MRKLIVGIVDFRERLLPQDSERFRSLAETQTPDALFVTKGTAVHSRPLTVNPPKS